MSAAIEFRNVSYRVGNSLILENLNFTVEPGETLVLVGQSGSGKTTALKMVNALVLPTAGDVVVEGKSTRHWNRIDLRRSIGYVIQDAGLFPHWTVAENVGLVPRLEKWDPVRRETRVTELLDQVGLPAAQYRSRYPWQLSGGQKQRVGVARALAAEPGMLLFDEPFGALDPIVRFELQNRFIELRRSFQKTSVFVTHDLREALRIASRIGLLHGGRLAELAMPSDFLKTGVPEAQQLLATLQVQTGPA